MNTVIFIYLVTRALAFIVGKKFGLEDKLLFSTNRILYKLGTCAFCFHFWIAVVVTVVLYFLPSAIWLDPLAAMGIFIVVNDFKNKGNE